MSKDMLPPSQFNGGHNGDGPLYPEYDPEIWDSQEEADRAYELIDTWKDGSGFSTEEWMDSITDIRNLEFNEEGDLIGFTFDFETEDGYSGTRSVP
jgi:hypothetical protein